MLSDSKLGSGSNSVENSDWDKFSSREASSLNTNDVAAKGSPQAQVRGGRLCGVTSWQKHHR